MWDEFVSRFAMVWKPLAAGVAILVAAASTAGVWFHFREQPKEMLLPGTVETQEVRLSSRVGGRVATLLVSESQIVEPGQTSVELEMPELDAQRAQLVAQADAAHDDLAPLDHAARAAAEEA